MEFDRYSVAARGVFLSAAVLLVAPITAMAAPAITATSGTASAGQALTISGSGFGRHDSYNNISDTWNGARYLNFRFKDFEDGALKSHGFYPQAGGSPWDPDSTELSVQSGGPANSTKYMRRMYEVEDGGLSADVLGAGNQLYTSFKFMVPPGTQSGKIFRFYADDPQHNAYISTGCTDFMLRGFSECTADSCTDAKTQWGTGQPLTPSHWSRVEIWANANDNTVTASLDGVPVWTMPSWLNTAGLALNGHTIDFPNMIDSDRNPDICHPTGSYNYDDIYVDFTQARVEIGDAPTWSASRHKEVQIPTSWSDSFIQVRVNTGEFNSGAQAYLYVVDSNGNVNANGTPLKIGSSGGGTPPPPPPRAPNPPTNVTVK